MENITLARPLVAAHAYRSVKPAEEQARGTAAPPQPQPEQVARQEETPGANPLAAAQLARQQALSAAAPEEAEPAFTDAGKTEPTPTESLLSQSDEEVKNLLDMMQEAQKKAKEMREKLKLPKNSARYGYAAIEAYARLSRARSQSQVSSAAGYARRQLGQMQTALRQDPENAGRIRAAIRQLQSAVTRASRKKRELEEERIDGLRRKRAEKERRHGKAHRIEQETRRKQAVRKVRETGYISGACLDLIQQEHIEQQRAAQREQLEKIAGLGDGQTAQAVQAYTAQVAAPAVETPLPAAPASQAIPIE